jgi:flagellin
LYDKEFQQLKSFLNRAKSKQFNGVDLFSTNEIKVTIDSSRSDFLIPPVHLDSEVYQFTNEDSDTVNIQSFKNAEKSLNFISRAMSQIALDRAQIGAIQSRLDFTNSQLISTKENLSKAMSRINDVNVAEEATQYARYQIMVQSGTSMLSQANALPKTVLQLLA